jgi:anti-sigma-K factor RskA
MNYLQQERLDALSVNYVLGGMRGKARQRFQRLLMQQQQARESVWRWEQHLNPLAESLPAVEPDESLWQKLQQRLGWQQAEVVQLRPKSSWLHPANWVAVAAAACLALVLLLPPPATAPVELAVIQTKEAKALWLVSKQGDTVVLQATAAVTADPAHDYELWMLPTSGQPPISLGLLPQSGKVSYAWPKAAAGLVVAVLAVSLEPKGGSPTGQPTGAVLHTSELMTL